MDTITEAFARGMITREDVRVLTAAFRERRLSRNTPNEAASDLSDLREEMAQAAEVPSANGSMKQQN